MGGPHGQKSVWATAHTVPASMLVCAYARHSSDSTAFEAPVNSSQHGVS